MKTCPFCGKQVAADATVCGSCHQSLFSEFPEEAPRPPSAPKKPAPSPSTVQRPPSGLFDALASLTSVATVGLALLGVLGSGLYCLLAALGNNFGDPGFLTVFILILMAPCSALVAGIRSFARPLQSGLW